ncbi:MAG: hypothetical protein PHI48_04060 [Bacteroidales bacterium]|nr:hypothetical protein [Bacteroidales bacterium]
MKKVYFTLIGNTIGVNLEVSGGSQSFGYVITDRFRPDEVKKATKDLTAQTLESEFVNDIRFQINQINHIGALTRESIVASLKSSCINHIKQYKRLIDTDLYTYVDCVIHILESTNEISQSELKLLYSNYSNFVLNEYQNYIYVAKPPFGLVKLTDLMK